LWNSKGKMYLWPFLHTSTRRIVDDGKKIFDSMWLIVSEFKKKYEKK